MRAIATCGITSMLLASLLLWTVAWPREAVSCNTMAAASVKRDSVRCRVQSNVDACYDAIRWNPGDPALLVSLGDALVHAKRPNDALRNYLRAAELAPAMPSLDAKISAAEAMLHSKPAIARRSPSKRYSNAAVEAQTH